MKKNIYSRIASAVIAAGLTVFGFAGCGDTESANQQENSAPVSGSSASESASKSYTLNLGSSGDSTISFPLAQVAEQKGYFAEKGLTIESTKLENAGAVMYDALSVGKIDAAYAQAVPPISYGAQGYDVTIIGGNVSGGMYAVTKPENYDELKDVKNWTGHSIGVIQMSTSELTVRNALKTEYGLDPDNDIDFVMIEDYPSISLGVQKGNVDIGFIGSQYVEGAEAQGLVVLTTLYDIKNDYVCCRQSAYSKNAEANRDAYVIYLEGQIKAYKDLYTDQDETVSSFAKSSGETEEYIYNYIYNEETNGHLVYNPDPNYNGINGLYSIMLEQGYLESDLSTDEFVDLSIYADALKNVIAENPGDTFYTDMKDYFLTHNNEYPDFDKTYGEDFWG